MKAAIPTIPLLTLLVVSSVSLADETLYPPWNSWNHWRDSSCDLGWDYGYETGDVASVTVNVNLVATPIGISWVNQQCWNEQVWTAPSDDYYRFTFNYNASGEVTLGGASFWGNLNTFVAKAVLRLIPEGNTWIEGPYWYNYWRIVGTASGLPWPTDPYEYNEDLNITTGPIWFDEGETITIAGGILIFSFCETVWGFTFVEGDNYGELQSVEITTGNPPAPILAVDPDPPSHDFGQQTRIDPAEWTFNIWNRGIGTLDWDISSEDSWISLSPESGSSTVEWDSVTVTVETATLSLGSHNGSIDITSNAGSETGFIGIEIINAPPGADAGGPYSGTVDEEITFDASGSVDLDGTITGYRWDWDNDGTWDTVWSSSPTATHSFSAAGSYTVALEVKDNDEGTNSDNCACNIDLFSAIVYPDGSGDYPTIQAAIDAVSDSAVIFLGDGIFMGDGNRDLDFNGKAITVRSQSDDPENCVIDCQGSYGDPHRGFYFHSGEGPSSVIRGIMITNGYVCGTPPYDSGGAMFCDGDVCSPTIESCRIMENYAEEGGGGIYFNCDTYSTIVNCKFEENIANIARGGGVHFNSGGNPVINNCTFVGNYSYLNGGGISASNSAAPELNLTVNNCTFSQNEYGGIFCEHWETSVFLSNCVFIGNQWPGGVYLFDGASATIANSTFSENYGGIIVSQYCSIDVENTILAFSTDAEAIECEVDGATLTCCDVYGNAGGDWVGCIEDQYGVDGNISGDPFFCDPENDDYHIFDFSQCSPESSGCGLIGALEVGCWQDNFTVPGDYPTIQAAIDAASDHDIIELTDYAYTGPGNRDVDFLGKMITVHSQTGNPEDCIIDCMGLSRGFNFVSGEGANSVLEGVTIRNGSDEIGGGILCNYTSPTIRNCVIESNDASIEGAGVYCDHASPAIINSQINDNEASVRGGALMCYSSDPTLINLTLSDNWAGTEGGGVFLTNSSPTITNCILWNDSPEEIYILYSSDPAVTYCDVQGSWPGEGNIYENPRFGFDAYHLQYGSPCINAGDPNYIPDPGETDIDGELRVMRGRVDIGADEVPNIPHHKGTTQWR